MSVKNFKVDERVSESELDPKGQYGVCTKYIHKLMTLGLNFSCNNVTIFSLYMGLLNHALSLNSSHISIIARGQHETTKIKSLAPLYSPRLPHFLSHHHRSKT